MGQGLVGRHTHSLNIQQFGHGMQLKNFGFPCILLHVCIFVSVRVFCIYVCMQKINIHKLV